jgi:HEAT repeat protein
MIEYPPPVDRLLSLGDLRENRTWIDYRAKLGLGLVHVADLIRMATDQELNQRDAEDKEVWAPIHALRALGQLRAVDAVEPLLAMLSTLDEADDYVLSDLPEALGLIGPAAIPASARLLADPTQKEFVRTSSAMALEEIGKAHPEARSECVEILTRQLATHEQGREAQAVNDFIVSALIALEAVESAPEIEAAFASGMVDGVLTGTWEHVRHDLGLGPRPSTPRYPLLQEFVDAISPKPPPARPSLAKLKKKKQDEKRAKKQQRR